MALPILTERLEIRPFETSDLQALHAVYGDPEVTRWMPSYSSIGQTRRALEKHVAGGRAGGPALWAVVERASGELIGDAGFAPLDGVGPEVELGYTLGRRWWGRGYATEAAGACLGEAFGPLGLKRVVAVVRPENEASKHVLEKLGMEREGTRFAHGAEHLLYATSALEAPAGSAARSR